MDLIEKISSLKWGLSKQEYRNVFSDKHFVNYYPEEKNAVVFLEINNGIKTVVSAFFINENLDKLASIIITFLNTNHQRLDDNVSNDLFEKNKNDLMAIYGKPNCLNNNPPMEFYMSKFINWKTENSIITLDLQLSEDYKALSLSKNISAKVLAFNIPPSVGINIVDINREKEIDEYISKQSIKMRQSQDKELEKELEKFYVPMLQKTMKVSLLQARDIFSDMLSRAKKRSKNSDTVNLPNNEGDIILKDEVTNKKLKLGLDRKRAEGVTDEDIKWWWNTPDIARSMALEIDLLVKITTLHGLMRKNGLSEKEALEEIPRYCPIFGDPCDSSDSDNRHNPLPFELKNRVNIYNEKRQKTDPEQFKKEIEESSSFNFLIRKEIKKNNL